MIKMTVRNISDDDVTSRQVLSFQDAAIDRIKELQDTFMEFERLNNSSIIHQVAKSIYSIVQELREIEPEVQKYINDKVLFIEDEDGDKIKYTLGEYKAIENIDNFIKTEKGIKYINIEEYGHVFEVIYDPSEEKYNIFKDGLKLNENEVVQTFYDVLKKVIAELNYVK